MHQKSDVETGLYYLKSRYYNPEIGRFISPDDISYLDPSTIGGVNQYAYCGNNPIMYFDSNGTSFKSVLGDIGRFIGGVIITGVGAVATIITAKLALIPVFSFVPQFFFSTTMYGIYVESSSFSSQIYKDMDSIGWNPFNTNENAVISAGSVSFYKGQAVIKGNYPGCMSFGIMFVDKGTWVTPDTIKHEYGHFIQMGILGVVKYTLGIAIPSLIGTQTYKGHYESQLWERTADWFGGANNGPYDKNSLFWSMLYFTALLIF